MRLYIDTNIIVFLFMGGDDLSVDIRSILTDCTNSIMTSSICAAEFVYLCQIGKVPISKRSPIKYPDDIIEWIEDIGVTIATPTTASSLLRPSVTAFRSSAQTGSSRNMRDTASTLYSTKDRYKSSGL